MIVARWQRGGERFEVVIDPEKALLFRQGKATLDDALRSPHVFTDAKKGERAGSQSLKKAFGSEDEAAVAAQIIQKGDIPVSKTQREEQLGQVRARIVGMIHRAGVDPRTHAPHPVTRIENAMLEAKVRLDPNRTAEEQLQEVLKAIRPIIPIKEEKHQLDVQVPVDQIHSAMRVLKGQSKVLREEWQSNGDLRAIVEIPGGLSVDFQDALMKATHGKAQFTILKRE